MPIQKNNSCRMGGPKKGQWVTIILIRASTGVGENHNHLTSESLNKFSSSSNIIIGKALLIIIIITRLQEKNTNIFD